MQGDACALPFPDQSFDVVFSNAVIEHVGDVERQRQFVAEALRVGRRVFVTTPNRWFPIEVHTRLPLVHWLPKGGSDRAYELTGKGWARENHLLGQRRPARASSRPGPDRQPRSHARRDHMSERLPRIALAVLDRRPRGPQPRDGGAVGCRHPRRLARCRRRLEGRAARRRPRGRARSARARCRCGSGPTGSRSPTRRSCSLYWLLPQSWLDGAATHRGQLFAARHDLIPVAAYFLGRLLVLTPQSWRRLSLALVGVAVALTVWGLIDVYLVPLQWWRDSGVPGWFEDQLGLDYKGISGLPENWIFNTGDENNPIRRLVSGFLSPLATSYVLVIVLLYLVARRRTWWTVTAGAIAYAGLLWTHTRAAYLALALGLVVLAVAQRRFLPVALAVASLVIGVGFVKAFPHIGPSTSYTQTELDYLRDKGAAESRASATTRSARAMPRPRATSATSATASAR